MDSSCSTVKEQRLLLSCRASSYYIFLFFSSIGRNFQNIQLVQSREATVTYLSRQWRADALRESPHHRCPGDSTGKKRVILGMALDRLENLEREAYSYVAHGGFETP